MSDGWFRTERGTLMKRYGPAPSPVAAGSFPCPQIIGDSMPMTEHVDGNFYDSKSKFRQVTKDQGCIEVGNDPARHKLIQRPKPDVKARREAVQKAISKAGL